MSVSTILVKNDERLEGMMKEETDRWLTVELLLKKSQVNLGEAYYRV